MAAWADGLITVNSPSESLHAVIDAFRAGGGVGKPVHVQMHLSWAASDEEAENQAVDQWRTNALPPTLNEELETPEQLDAASRQLSAEDLRDSVLMSADLERHAEAIAGLDRDFGIERVYLHQVGTDQQPFIEAFADGVLPLVRQ